MTATLTDFSRQLDDPSQWEVRPGIPVFDEHDEWHVPDPKAPGGYREVHTLPGEPPPAGGKLYDRIDGKRLQLIAARMNARERASGEYCAITLGHTRPGLAEKDQPEIVGYARGWNVGRLGRSGRLALLTAHYFRKDRFEEARSFPRRSVEFWRADNMIDPIALLRRTPKRDLGTVHYNAPESERSFYEMGAPTMTPTVDAAADPAAIPFDALDQRYVQLTDPAWLAVSQPAVSADPSSQVAAEQGFDLAGAPPEAAGYSRHAQLANYQRSLEGLARMGVDIDVAAEMRTCARMSPKEFDQFQADLYSRHEREAAAHYDRGEAAQYNRVDQLTADQAQRVSKYALANKLGYNQARAQLYPAR